MVVFTIVFGKLAKLPSEGVPYPILVFAAMLPWQFFANAFSESGNSLIANSNLISKVYFPRLVISIMGRCILAKANKEYFAKIQSGESDGYFTGK
jgi:ABC-type polysaccharide/polyol phosphate export permease